MSLIFKRNLIFFSLFVSTQFLFQFDQTVETEPNSSPVPLPNSDLDSSRPNNTLNPYFTLTPASSSNKLEARSEQKNNSHLQAKQKEILAWVDKNQLRNIKDLFNSDERQKSFGKLKNSDQLEILKGCVATCRNNKSLSSLAIPPQIYLQAFMGKWENAKFVFGNHLSDGLQYLLDNRQSRLRHTSLETLKLLNDFCTTNFNNFAKTLLPYPQSENPNGLGIPVSYPYKIMKLLPEITDICATIPAFRPFKNKLNFWFEHQLPIVMSTNYPLLLGEQDPSPEQSNSIIKLTYLFNYQKINPKAFKKWALSNVVKFYDLMKKWGESNKYSWEFINKHPALFAEICTKAPGEKNFITLYKDIWSLDWEMWNTNPKNARILAIINIPNTHRKKTPNTLWQKSRPRKMQQPSIAVN